MAGGAMIDALAPMPAAAMTGTGAMAGGGSPPHFKLLVEFEMSSQKLGYGQMLPLGTCLDYSN